MPNIQISTLDNLSLPFKEEGYFFYPLAKSPINGEEILLVSFEGKRFTFIVKRREKDILIKADKITNVLPIGVIQKALRILSKNLKAEIFYSNVNSKKSKKAKISSYFKDMRYFYNEFKADRDILVEVGFGSGRHLLYQAKKNPDSLVIGLEIHRPSIDPVLRRVEVEGIENILVVNYDARIFLEFLPSNSVDKIFIHFPVPWDKKPHRRVICEDFINESIRVLKKDATLELRTDSENYFRYSLDLFLDLNKSSLEIFKNRELEISSKYEDRWRRLNKNIYDLIYNNEEISPFREKPAPLIFENKVLFSKIKEKFKKEIFLEKDFFIHFENIYEISKEEGLLKVSMGAYQKSEHLYLFINKEGLKYIPLDILPSFSNVKAHKKLKEWIYG